MFRIEVTDRDNRVRFRVWHGDKAGWSEPRDYALPRRDHAAYLDLFEALARDFGLRMPNGRRARSAAASALPVRPLITENLAAEILYGYGDPSVMRQGGRDGAAHFLLVVTSNDAPHTFPLLRSKDLRGWELAGFAFPPGQKPAWAASDGHGAEYWAPEIHRVGGRYQLCFAARQPEGGFAIGLASADMSTGPFVPADRPLITGGVIDPHLHVAKDGRVLLFWKHDSNDIWPGLLGSMLDRQPWLGEQLFPREEDRRTAAFAGALSSWIDTLDAMERFLVLQTLIEAVTADYPGFKRRLRDIDEAESSGQILDAMGTSILAQELDLAAGALVGEAVPVLHNDLEWEGHLVEGAWLWEQDGRYYIFYSGNDFASPHYGIGVAVGPSPLGPFRKRPTPLLCAGGDWEGFGHPSAALGPDGELRLFFHGYRKGQAGYKSFRALLTAVIVPSLLVF